MEKMKRIYNRPKIDWVFGKPKCFCNECDKEICGVDFDLSNIPIICKECQIKKRPLVNPLLS